MLTRFCFRSLGVAVLSAISFLSISAQTPNDKALLKGRIFDPNRAAIQGADVWVSKAGLPAVTAVSDRNGEFSMALVPGEDQVRISAEGFTETT